MDFFSLQDDALARSRKFYLAFALAMLLAVVVLYFAVTGALIVMFNAPGLGLIPNLPKVIFGDSPKVLSLRSFLIIGTITASVILYISIRRTSFIREGGGAYIAEILDARLLETPANLNESRLLNIVEEMAVAAGLPRPRVYIIPGMRSINAITAGADHDDAIIAITEGAVKHLERDELQGVIAHEFAHILNGDYSLNLTMAGWLYGLMFFYIQGRRIFLSIWDFGLAMAKHDDIQGFHPGCAVAVPGMIVGCLLMAGGWIGKMGGQIIQAAFSRQREYLADAFAVQFTRNPQGLAGAMKKIAWAPRGGFIKSSDAMTMQAFFIVSPANFQKLFQSHPPLERRIQILDPAWDGEPLPIDHDDFRPPKDLNAKYSYGPAKSPAPLSRNKLRPQVAERLKQVNGWSGLLVLGLMEAGLDEGARVFEASESLEAAHRLYADIPEPLRAAADALDEVSVLVAAIFLQSEAEIRPKQKLIIEKRLGEEAAAMAVALKNQMGDDHRLPLLGLATPTLKGLTEEEKENLSRLIKNLVAVDGKLDLFEIAACQILKKSLGEILLSGPVDQQAGVAAYIDQVRQHAVTVISLIACLDVQNDQEAREAFEQAMKHFKQWPPQQMTPRSQITSKVLIGSLDFLSRAPVKVRNSLVAAAASVCLRKEQISDSQYQLLRALAAAVDVPMPLLKNRPDENLK